MAVSCGWNMPYEHRYLVGIITVLLIFLSILFNIARWLAFVHKYLTMNCRRCYNRRKAATKIKRIQRISKKEVDNLMSVETERGLISPIR